MGNRGFNPALTKWLNDNGFVSGDWQEASPTVVAEAEKALGLGPLDYSGWPMKTAKTKRKPTIYEALQGKLGRNPTNAELKADVERIKGEGYAMAAAGGKLRHQRKPKAAARPRMGYLKLTRAGLGSVWFQRATVGGHQAKNKASSASPLATAMAMSLWESMSWSGEGMVTTAPKNAEVFLRWARSLEGWRDGYAVWEPTGESRL
jgi:hypothetical protein